MTMRLKPSDIYYCQDSINNVFDAKSNHRGQLIGGTLDDIVAGRCSIESVPRIQVCYVNGKWFSADNRRLWVFKNLYSLGKCDTIPVIKVPYIYYRKFTTKNGGTSIRVRRDPGGKWHREAEQRRQNKELLDRYKPSSTDSSGQTQISQNAADINTVFNQLQLEDNIDSRPSGVNVGCGIVKPKQEIRMTNMQNITGVQRNTNCDESVQNFQDHASTITRTNGWTNTNVIETHPTYRERLNVPRIKNEQSRVATWINDDDFSLGKSPSDENTSTNRHNPVDSDRTNIGSHSMNTAKRASCVDRCNEQTVASGVYRGQSDTTGFVRQEQRTSSAKSTIQPCSLATKKTPETDFKFNQSPFSTLKTTSEMEHGNKYSATSYGRETKYEGTSITERGDPGGAWHREAEQRCQNRELLEKRYKPSTYSNAKTQVSRNVADINTVFNQLQLQDNIDSRPSGVNVGCGIVKPKQEMQMINMQNITGVQRNTNCDESVQNFQDHASPITRTNGWTNTNVIETHQTYRERLNVPRIKNEPVTGTTWIYDDNFSLRKSTSDENTSTNRHNPVDSDRTNSESHSMNTAKRTPYLDSYYEQSVTSSGGYRGQSDTMDLVKNEKRIFSAKSTNQPCILATKRTSGTGFNTFNQSPFSTLKTTSPLEHRNRYSATGYEKQTASVRSENNKTLLQSGSETSAKPTRTESEFTKYRDKTNATGYERPTTSVRSENNKTLLLSGSETLAKPTRTESEFTEYRNKTNATGYERPTYVRAENNNKTLLQSRSETSAKPTRTESEFTGFHRSAANSKAKEYNEHSSKVSSNTKTDRALQPQQVYLAKPPSHILFTEINQNRDTFRTQYVFKQLLMQDDEVISPITLYRYKGTYWALDGNDILLAYKMAERHKPDICIRVTISENEDEFKSIIMKERPLSVALDIITLKLQKFC